MADNDPVITLQQSQAANGYNAEGQAVGIPLIDESGSGFRLNPESGRLMTADGLDPTVVPTKPALNMGVGANDDSGTVTAKTTQQAANQVQTSDIAPQPNILDKYASYTYSISWFLLDPTAQISQSSRKFASEMQGKNKLLQNAQLLVRSGGMPRDLKPEQNAFSTSVLTKPSPLFNVAPEFDLDFFIDNLEIDSKFWGKGSGSPHNAIRLKFTITEPYGITLIPRLYKTVHNFFSQRGIVTGKTKPNYVAAQYGLLISFYGYDEAGNLVKANNINRSLSNYQVVDSQAVVEKFYPFIIRSVKFRIANKITEYSVEGVPLMYAINATQSRNTIPFAASFTGATVQDILLGKIKPQAANIEQDGRQSSAAPTSALNTNADTNIA